MMLILLDFFIHKSEFMLKIIIFRSSKLYTYKFLLWHDYLLDKSRLWFKKFRKLIVIGFENDPITSVINAVAVVAAQPEQFDVIV